MSAPPPVAPATALMARFQTRRPIRVASLIVTIFGDCIAPRGGSLWLGTLVDILGRFGIEPGLVRTALSRLVAEGLFERERLGRSAFYRLSAASAAAAEAAAARIYRPPPAAWSGRWRLALPLPGADPATFKAALAAAGFRPVGHGFATPVLEEGNAPLPEGLMLVEGELLAPPPGAMAGQLVDWDGLAAGWRDYVAALAEPAPPAIGEDEALVRRILLVHEFRRLVLKEPPWPAPLFPPDWPGEHARKETARAYGGVFADAENWLDRHALGPDGPLPPPRDHASRFRLS